MLQLNCGVVSASVVGPGDTLFVERFADGADIGRGDRTALRNANRVDGAVREKPRIVVIHQIVAPGLALGAGRVRKGSQVIHDWPDAGLREIAALREVAIETQVHRVDVVCSWD